METLTESDEWKRKEEAEREREIVRNYKTKRAITSEEDNWRFYCI